jgi:outer membrane protein assembly factor BamB
VVAAGRVVVARPDAHEVVAMDADSGAVAWRFTAGGRVDTAPTLHNGLCLFGSKDGWVNCLRADDGRLVWRLRAAPVDERIVAYGQLESPWPVPGSVLVIDNVAYLAAGRQSLADGGILVFDVDPASGKITWVRRLDSVPQQGFYECSALEFDNFDLLHREGDDVGMSRWVFDRKTGEMSLDRWAAFARLNTGGGSVMAPRGCWSYAPRHQARIPSYTPLRPLAVYHDNVLFGCLQGSSTVYRRDFDLEGGEEFDTKWMTGWDASNLSRQGKMPWRSYRLAEKASWKVNPFGEAKDAPPIHAMVLAGNKLLLGAASGDFRVISTGDGRLLAGQSLPEPLWDGAAVAQGRLYYATRDGQLLCLGDSRGNK